ncbi:hypothetical protein AB0N06_20350 [Streptomyces sp. NPDC051020]|uniref:acyl-CoA thioesterase n=1 Tax=Streptomyces sp. NPDC051020 TaxID=3155409 RepID=UPI0034160C69
MSTSTTRSWTTCSARAPTSGSSQSHTSHGPAPGTAEQLRPPVWSALPRSGPDPGQRLPVFLHTVHLTTCWMDGLPPIARVCAWRAEHASKRSLHQKHAGHRALPAPITAHAMSFHRPFRVDEWFLYEQESPIATGGRGLARGRIYDRGGNLLVSVVQEGLFRRLGA